MLQLQLCYGHWTATPSDAAAAGYNYYCYYEAERGFKDVLRQNEHL